MAGRRVVFLGTGGALNVERYQSSILVESGSVRILLDTGGGLGLVRRLLAAGIDPASVNHVFLSHRHLDHVGGLEPFILTVSLDARRRGVEPPPVTIYASEDSARAVNATLDAADAAGRGRLGARLRWATPAFAAREAVAPGVALTLVPVDHLPRGGGAAGCVVDLDGVRVAYSGDTMPSPALAQAAHGVDLLIHEVGGLDAQADTVHVPYHSTAGEAGRIAAAAGARALALFHLPSSAYANPGELLAEARRFAPDTDVFVTEDGAARPL
ncbi:MAG: MBL fold metallo-hydrolase [Candidatus Rokubacteria bacterium]|nr:MBL fold metallo-hydrolase [Candidatus Rokubacteria bacterium]